MTTAVPSEPATPVPPTAAADLSHVDLSHVDYGALTDPITRAEVRAFRTRERLAHRGNPNISSALDTATTFTAALAVPVFVVILGGFITTFIHAGLFGPGARTLRTDGVITILVMLAFGVSIVVIIRKQFGSAGPWTRMFRLTNFAAANGLLYSAVTRDIDYPGTIFQRGDHRGAYDHLMTAEGRFFDTGNYLYWTGSGKNREVHRWGYLALKLDRQLPNMVLEAKANRSLLGTSDLPITFDRSQILELEGDFQKYFTLYCPAQYESDALYVFTPDLMALLVDNAATFDVEIVDDWMFFYARRPLASLNPAVYARMFGIVELIGAKALHQTAEYSDRRVAPSANYVAPEGQRLRHRVSIPTLVITGVLVIGWFVLMFHGVH